MGIGIYYLIVERNFGLPPRYPERFPRDFEDFFEKFPTYRRQVPPPRSWQIGNHPSRPSGDFKRLIHDPENAGLEAKRETHQSAASRRANGHA